MSDKKDEGKINIDKLKSKDEKEFEKFYRFYINRIYTVIYRVVGNEADSNDLAVEVMMKVYEKIDTFRGDAKLSSWVYRIAYNQAISFLRKNKRTISMDEVKVEKESDRHIRYMERMELKELLKKKLMELPEKYRVALSLYHFEDLSYKEIAYTMDIEMGTVKTYIYRGREQLREMLQGMDFEL